MYRPGANRGYGGRPGGASKASADTLCQKCLKRGHYSYECTASAQDRPYKARPSRTQQLLNPQLKPKLMMDIPNDLTRKKGIADEMLAKKEEERGRKSSRNLSRKRTRSRSSSFDSVSTISTNASRSPKRSAHNGTSSSRTGNLGKRRRRSVSATESESDRSDDREYVDRNTRRRMSSFSPGQRGRRRSRSGSGRIETSRDCAPRYRGNKLPSSSRSPRRNRRKASRRLTPSRSPSNGAVDRRRRSVSDVMDRMDISGEHAYPDRNRPKPSRSPSPYRPGRSPSPYSRGAKKRSTSPYSRRTGRRSPGPLSRRPARSPSPFRAQNGHRGYGIPRGSRLNHFNDRRPEPATGANIPAPPPQRERSLSPYSKRLAMTRAMQAE